MEVITFKTPYVSLRIHTAFYWQSFLCNFHKEIAKTNAVLKHGVLKDNLYNSLYHNVYMPNYIGKYSGGYIFASTDTDTKGEDMKDTLTGGGTDTIKRKKIEHLVPLGLVILPSKKNINTQLKHDGKTSSDLEVEDDSIWTELYDKIKPSSIHVNPESAIENIRNNKMSSPTHTPKHTPIQQKKKTKRKSNTPTKTKKDTKKTVKYGVLKANK